MKQKYKIEFPFTEMLPTIFNTNFQKQSLSEKRLMKTKIYFTKNISWYQESKEPGETQASGFSPKTPQVRCSSRSLGPLK